MSDKPLLNVFARLCVSAVETENLIQSTMQINHTG